MLSVISYQPIKLQVENIQNAYGLLHAATKIKILHLNMHAWGLATGDEHSIIMRKFHVFIMCQFIKYIGFKALRIYRNSGNILKKSYCLF